MPAKGWWRDATGVWRDPDEIDSTAEDINCHARFYLKKAAGDPLQAEELARYCVELPAEARRQIIAAIWDISGQSSP